MVACPGLAALTSHALQGICIPCMHQKLHSCFDIVFYDLSPPCVTAYHWQHLQAVVALSVLLGVVLYVLQCVNCNISSNCCCMCKNHCIAVK